MVRKGKYRDRKMGRMGEIRDGKEWKMRVWQEGRGENGEVVEEENEGKGNRSENK